MSATISSPTAARSRVANLVRSRCNADEVRAARQVLAMANIAASVRENLQKYPPLTVEQRTQLVALILSGGDH